MTIRPYKSTLPPEFERNDASGNEEVTITDVVTAPTRNETAHRMFCEVQAEPDAHKRQVARAQLIRFLCEGQDIVARAAREKVSKKA